MDIRQRLGRNLRHLREVKGWRQEEFANSAGIHRTDVSEIEAWRWDPTDPMVEKLAVPLRVPKGDLLI